jgi:hypothetical protein
LRLPVRAGVTLVAVLLTSLAGLGLASPASAATIDCTPMGDPACRTLVGLAECVWVETNGSRTVVWGYNNPSTSVLNIDIGNKNSMSPGAADQGQPTTFLIGMHHNAFVTNFTGTSTSWRLGNDTISVSASTPACATKPVPLIGDVTALVVYLLLLSLAVPAAIRPRRAQPGPRRTVRGIA